MMDGDKIYNTLIDPEMHQRNTSSLKRPVDAWQCSYILIENLGLLILQCSLGCKSLNPSSGNFRRHIVSDVQMKAFCTSKIKRAPKSSRKNCTIFWIASVKTSLADFGSVPNLQMDVESHVGCKQCVSGSMVSALLLWLNRYSKSLIA